jgi:hypothetical protein
LDDFDEVPDAVVALDESGAEPTSGGIEGHADGR